MTENNDHNTVLFFLSPQGQRYPTNYKLASIFRYAHNSGWHVQALDAPANSSEILSLMHDWHAIGCIVSVDSSRKYFGVRNLKSIPVVFMDFDDKIIAGNCFRINHDPDEVGALAARHLAASKLENYAFLGFPPDFIWSNERKRSFRDHLGNKAKTFSSFVLPYNCKPDKRTQRKFLFWLERLPKPCGLMLAADCLALNLYPACMNLGIRIPNDLAVIGVDDDEAFCSNLIPPLTSIRLDMTQSGWMAAELLDRRLRDPHLSPTVLYYHTLGIARRKSDPCQTIAGRQLAEQVMKAITNTACAGVNVSKLAKSFNFSRRLLEIRFRETYGISVLEAIRHHRLECVCHELRETNKPVALVLATCGCKSETSFKHYFKSVTGLSMREYRKANARCPELTNDASTPTSRSKRL